MSEEKQVCCDSKTKYGPGAGGGVYGLAFLGSLYYFLQHADTFWMGVLGVVKAIFWPAVLIYRLLEFLGM